MIDRSLPLPLFQMRRYRENYVPVVPNRLCEFLISIGALFQSKEIILDPFSGRIFSLQSVGFQFLPDSRNLFEPCIELLLHERDVETD